MASLQLDLLVDRSGGAAENMATDFLLLQRYSIPGYLRFRHYNWHRPAFTFGYSQKISFVRQQLPSDSTVELCRRPTGGGVVDHRNDWTYALVIPRSHPAYDARAVESYRLIHTCLADVLRARGQSAILKERCDTTDEETTCTPGICFNRAELFDVIREDTGQKIAGAAQKRNKHGLLFQGSVSRLALAAPLDWEEFQTDLGQRLAAALNAEAQPAPWPEWEEEELSQLIDHYSTPEWNEFR